jgi:adenylate kinase
MDKQFYIIIGRSGSGKGTQVERLKEVLEKKGPKAKHFTTGGGFRDFINRDAYIAKLSKKVNSEGGLQPEFLAVWNWANIFIENLEEGETILLDGAPRKVYEMEALHSAVTFLQYKNPIVIYLDVSEGWAKERLLGRGRGDDTLHEVEKRLSWFETDTLPVIDKYIHDPRYKVFHINGEQSVEDVHQEIVQKVGLL